MANDPMTKQLTKCNAVIRMDDYAPQDVYDALERMIEQYLKLDCDFYAGIVHDMDFDDDGKKILPHIHLVFKLKKRARKSTIINRLCDCYSGLTPFAVSLDGYSSFEGSFQYLVHFNRPSKHQYSVDDIKTNLTEGEIDLVMASKAVALDLASLKAFCLTASDLVEVIEFVGISTYQHYRATILDVFNWCLKVREEEARRRLMGKDTSNCDK